jgi:hypothetical protein
VVPAASARRIEAREEVATMTAHVRDPERGLTSAHAGTLTLLLGCAFLAATGFTYVLSLGVAFNPPDWVRVAALVWLPIGFFGTPIAYAIARRGPGRDRGRVGVGIALVALVAFVVLQFALG